MESYKSATSSEAEVYISEPYYCLSIFTHCIIEMLPVILLSDRKYALTLDEKFTTDLMNFSNFTATVGKKPTDIPYDK